jgi:hypothetical protein
MIIVPADCRVVPDRHSCLSGVEDNRVVDCRSTGALWKRFLLARATAAEREVPGLSRILAGKWRAGY